MDNFIVVSNNRVENRPHHFRKVDLALIVFNMVAYVQAENDFVQLRVVNLVAVVP